MRTSAPLLCVIVAACGNDGMIETTPGETEEEPACAADPGSARLDVGELPWDLDLDLSSNDPGCPAGEPDCDRLDEADAAEDTGDFIYALTDPLTTSGNYRTWPNGRIPYRYARDSAGNILVNADTRTRLSQAMTNWESLTEGRIKFRAKASTDTAYVIIREGSPRVSPFVGYRKDQIQNLYLRDSEYITVIKHELGHVVGLHHEQRRSDRSSYIQVRTANIVNSETCRYQFSVCTTCKRVGTYNRGSVMHYRTTDLANCRTGPVLLKLDGTAISHYWQLTAKDLSAVATMYDATGGTTPPPPPPTDTLPDTGSMLADGQCAAIPDANMTEGATVETRACDGGGNQDWRVTSDGQLRVSHSLQCARVVDCSYEGAIVEQAACSTTAPDQKWTFAEMEIVNGMTGKCVDLASYEAGRVAGFAACTGAPSQRIAYRTETETFEAGGLCLTASTAAAAGDDVTLAACDGRDAQRWFQARGGFVTRVNTARCIRVEGGPATGTKLELGDCTDAMDQRWAMRGKIRDARAGLCLQAGSAEDPRLTLATCDEGTSQVWTFWSR